MLSCEGALRQLLSVILVVRLFLQNFVEFLVRVSSGLIA